MKTTIVLLVLLALVLFYILQGRAWLKKQPWTEGFFKVVEPIESMLWKKSESILFARLMMLLGALPVIAQQLQLFNMPEIANLVPEKYRGYLMLIFTVCGIIVEINRRYTTQPIEITAMPEAAMPPEVKAVVEKAAETNAEAVVKVEEVKAETKT